MLTSEPKLHIADVLFFNSCSAQDMTAWNLEAYFKILYPQGIDCMCLFIVLMDGSLHPLCPLGNQNSFQPEIVRVFTYSPLFMCVSFTLASSWS